MRTTPKPFKRQVTQILTPDGPAPVLIGKIEPILYDELCVMAQWLMENSDSSESAESTTQTYQMWIGLGSETIFFSMRTTILCNNNVESYLSIEFREP